jgi:hypothetical protein
MFHHQNAGQNDNIKVANTSFENSGKIEIFGNTSNKSKLN